MQQSIILSKPLTRTAYPIGTLSATAGTVDEGRKACISIKTKRVYLEMYPQDIDDKIIRCGQCTELNERDGRIKKESVGTIEKVCGYDRKSLWVR